EQQALLAWQRRRLALAGAEGRDQTARRGTHALAGQEAVPRLGAARGAAWSLERDPLRSRFLREHHAGRARFSPRTTRLTSPLWPRCRTSSRRSSALSPKRKSAFQTPRSTTTTAKRRRSAGA